MKRELDCIVCPMSCRIELELSEDGLVSSVQGNSCPRGEVFAHQEMTCPMRMLTTTLRIHHAQQPLLPVITSQSVPKDKLFAIMEACKTLEVEAPIHVQSVLVKNIANSGADLLASRSMEMRSEFDESKNHTSYQ